MNMIRMTFILDEDQRKRAMEYATAREITTYTSVLKEAVAMWIEREEMRDEIQADIKTILRRLPP